MSFLIWLLLAPFRLLAAIIRGIGEATAGLVQLVIILLIIGAIVSFVRSLL
jgi:hypothetical protein